MSAAARTMLLGALVLIGSAAGAGQPTPAPRLAKLRGETDKAFAARVLQGEGSDARVLATTWNGVRTLFVDYLRDADTEAPERPLIALEEAAPGQFRKRLVTIGETEGGAPDIAAIGFANVDRDPATELIVILAWRQAHAGACSPLYEVRILDDRYAAGTTLRRLPISEHFGVGCAGQPERFRFTTIGAVKAELSSLRP